MRRLNSVMNYFLVDTKIKLTLLGEVLSGFILVNKIF